MKKLSLSLLLAFVYMSVGAQVHNRVPELIGSWSGKLDLGSMALTLVFHFEQADGYVVCTMDSPDQGAKGLGIYKEHLTADSVSLSMPALGASYRARRDGERLVGTFAQMGVSFPLTLDKGSVGPKRPQMPVEPYPYNTEEVTFVNVADNATLVGTLTYPVGYEAGERVPVVVMVSGSGLQNRDEEIFDHKPFLVLADHLARKGIASLRYDDRAFGASVGGNRTMNKATTSDYCRDAEAAVEYLRGLNRFSLVGVVGHSEGGNVGFMLGGRGVVDFIVSLAGVGVRGDEALAAQYNRIVELQGGAQKMSVEQYRDYVHSIGSDWMDWFMDYDPTADIAATKCPVLALNGSKDCQVLSEQNLPAIERVLPQNDRSQVKEYEGLNHLFQPCTTGLPTEYYGIEQTLSEEVLADISDWIVGLITTH